MRSTLINRIFRIQNDSDFNDIAIEIFRYQYENNSVYHSFVDSLKVKPSAIQHYLDIPFLPIAFFKTHKIISGKSALEAVFESSGTTSVNTSRHYCHDLLLYEESFKKAFEQFYGKISNYIICALLPSYLERGGSSLVYMANKMIQISGKADSSFYLDNYDELALKLRQFDKEGIKVLLMGVTYALLDMIEAYDFDLKHTIIMETGGMKGRRREMVREELHQLLCAGFGVKSIHSEYGMTELFSQAYSKGYGKFDSPAWMKILIRDVNDPLSLMANKKTGGINVMDLANIDSCSFIATQDLGRLYSDGSFEVLGRFDHSDVRGCNLLIG